MNTHRIPMDLIRRTQREAERDARREKAVARTLLTVAALFVCAKVFKMTANEIGWTSVSLFTWPMTIAIGGVFLLISSDCVHSFRIGRRWRAALAILCAVAIQYFVF